MAPPIPRGIYTVNLISELYGQRVQNAWHFVDHETSPADSHAEALAHLVNDWMDWAYPKITLWANQEWHTLGVIGKTLEPYNGPMAELGPLTGGGAQVDASLPSYCAGVLAFGTGNSGRRNRGRSYFAGVSAQLRDGNFLNGDSLGQLQDIGDAFVGRWGAFGTSTWHRLVVYSRVNGNVRVPGPPAEIHSTLAGCQYVVTATARRLICTNRHRMEGQGP